MKKYVINIGLVVALATASTTQMHAGCWTWFTTLIKKCCTRLVKSNQQAHDKVILLATEPKATVVQVPVDMNLLQTLKEALQAHVANFGQKYADYTKIVESTKTKANYAECASNILEPAFAGKDLAQALLDAVVNIEKGTNYGNNTLESIQKNMGRLEQYTNVITQYEGYLKRYDNTGQ